MKDSCQQWLTPSLHVLSIGTDTAYEQGSGADGVYAQTTPPAPFPV